MTNNCMQRVLRIGFFALCLSICALSAKDNDRPETAEDKIVPAIDWLSLNTNNQKTDSPNAPNNTLSLSVTQANRTLLPPSLQNYPISFDQALDIVWVYPTALTEVAAQQGYDPLNELWQGMSIAQQALESTGVNGYYRIKDVIEFPVFDSREEELFANARDVILAANTRSNIQFLKQKTGADFVLLAALASSGIGGFANVTHFVEAEGANKNQVTRVFPLFSQSSTVASGLGTDIVAHELGHNLGLQHDRQDFINRQLPTIDNYIAYGFSSASSQLATIMAAAEQCGNNPQCQQIVYSNPDITINGNPLGVAESETNAANGARVIRSSFGYASYLNSRFQPAVVHWQSTAEGVLVDWPEVQGASGYRVLPFGCETFDAGLDILAIQQADRVATSSALLNDITDKQAVCIVAENETNSQLTPSYIQLGSAYVSVGAQSLRTDANVYYLDRQRTQIIIELFVDDPSVNNNDIVLTPLYEQFNGVNENWFNSDDPQTLRMQQELNEILDYQITGEGSLRQITLTFSEPLERLAELVDDGLLRYLQPYRLRVGYLNSQNEALSTQLALSEQPGDNQDVKLINIPKQVEPNTSPAIYFSIVNAAPTADVQLGSIAGLTLDQLEVNTQPTGQTTRLDVTAAVTITDQGADEYNIPVLLDGVPMDGSVTLIVETINQPPELIIDTTGGRLEGETLTITSQATDPDGSIVSYQWTQVRGPALNTDSLQEPNLVLRNIRAGDYDIRLDVTDDRGAVANASIIFNILSASEDTPPQPPRANSSSGGSIYLFSILLLLLTSYHRRNRKD